MTAVCPRRPPRRVRTAACRSCATLAGPDVLDLKGDGDLASADERENVRSPPTRLRVWDGRSRRPRPASVSLGSARATRSIPQRRADGAVRRVVRPQRTRSSSGDPVAPVPAVLRIGTLRWADGTGSPAHRLSGPSSQPATGRVSGPVALADRADAEAVIAQSDGRRRPRRAGQRRSTPGSGLRPDGVR